MRLFLLAAAASLSASSAAAQKPPRDEPADLMTALGIQRPDPARIAAAIEAAAAHPLGSTENPVRVGGPSGERAYIARLRCADGSRPRVGQRGSMGIGPFLMIVDAYPLDCGEAAPGRTTLMMDMYHPGHREDRPPPGFSIAPR
jgi:hypothetical protein